MLSGTFSFLNVQATLAGPGGIISFGNGAGPTDEGISIEPNGDKNAMTVGADGSVMHNLHADKSGTITVRLLKTSPTNALFMAMYDYQSLSSTTWGKNVINVTDTGSGDTTGARSVAFKKKTGLTYSKDGRMNEWSFDCGVMDSLLGQY